MQTLAKASAPGTEIKNFRSTLYPKPDFFLYIFLSMMRYCKDCIDMITDSGVSLEVYNIICENYALYGVPVAFYEPFFGTVLHYLEQKKYVITTEIENNVILACPKRIFFDDGETSLFCSKNCLKAKSQL